MWQRALRLADSYDSLLVLLLANFFLLEVIDDPRWGAIGSTILAAVALVVAISDPDAGETVNKRQGLTILACVVLAPLVLFVNSESLVGLTYLLPVALLVTATLPVTLVPCPAPRPRHAPDRRRSALHVRAARAPVRVPLPRRGRPPQTRPFFAQAGVHQQSEYLYFSFVTLTTLGFGDLSPAVGLPQALVALEALLGQVFLVTLVARLVTLWVRQSAMRRRSLLRDPARKGRSMARVSSKNVGRWVPGVAMLTRYEKSWLRSDLVAGVVLAAILVPQGMAYAELAGLPAVNGLYTTVACLVGYAIFGPSRVLVLGPDSSLGPLIFAAILPLAVTDNPTELVAFAGFLALLVGAIEVGLGIGKLGFVADLLSKEVQVGYMMGLGVTIVVGQLPKLFGFSTDGDDFIEDVKAFVSGLDQRNRDTLIVGVAALALMLVLPRFTSRIPAVLITVILSTLAVSVFDLTSKGVTTVGSLPQGFPRPQIPSVDLGDVGALLAAAVGITLVSLADTIATSTSFAARRGDEVNASQEMIGIGAANAFAGLFQGFPISTSGSRTAVAEKSGAKSQVTGLVGAALVVVMLVLLPDLLSNLPNSALAAIVIAAALSLMDVTAATKFFRIRKSSFVLMLTATLGVIFFGVLEGILIAVALSILMFFRRSWWPKGEILGRVDSLDSWHSIRRYPEGTQVPGVVVFRWEAPLFFANAGQFRQEIRSMARKPDVRWVIIQCEAVTDIDVTAADMLERLDKELNAQGVNMLFVELRSRLHDLVVRYGLLETLDHTHFYDELDDALAAIGRDG